MGARARRGGELEERVQGFVLAGGESRRFGSDKTLASFRGRNLLEWPLSALRQMGIVPRVVTRNPSAHRGLTCAFVTGESLGLGPVEGLRAALASTRAPWSLVLSADMPGIEAGILEGLIREREIAAGRPVVFSVEGRIHPFPGLYSSRTLETLATLPRGASMIGLLEKLEAVKLGPDRLPAGAVTTQVFRNVNTPRDLQEPPETGPEYD